MRTLFVALLLGEERGRTLAGLVRGAIGESNALRWPRPEGLHLTLFYAGPTSPAGEERLIAELEDEGRRSPWPAPELVLDRASAFPQAGGAQERVLWVGCREEGAGPVRPGEPEQPGRLQRLRERTLESAERAGCNVGRERGRSFVPHVTVARPRKRLGPGQDAFGELYAWPHEVAWRPESLDLVVSEPAPGPRVYRSVWATALTP